MELQRVNIFMSIAVLHMAFLEQICILEDTNPILKVMFGMVAILRICDNESSPDYNWGILMI